MENYDIQQQSALVEKDFSASIKYVIFWKKLPKSI